MGSGMSIDLFNFEDAPTLARPLIWLFCVRHRFISR